MIQIHSTASVPTVINCGHSRRYPGILFRCGNPPLRRSSAHPSFGQPPGKLGQRVAGALLGPEKYSSFRAFLECGKTFLPLKDFKIGKFIIVVRVFSSLIRIFTFLHRVSTARCFSRFSLAASLALTLPPPQLLQASLYSSAILLVFCFSILFSILLFSIHCFSICFQVVFSFISLFFFPFF